MRRFLFAGVCITSMCASSAVAQNLSYHPPSVDVTLGANRGAGGEYFDYAGVAAALTFVRSHSGHGISGVTVGGRAPIGHGDVCAFDESRTRCLDRFPSMVGINPFIGTERATTKVSIRAMIGPALFLGAGDGFGGVVRTDVAVGVSHIKFVVAGEGGIDIRSHETLGLGTLLFGFRLQ